MMGGFLVKVHFVNAGELQAAGAGLSRYPEFRSSSSNHTGKLALDAPSRSASTQNFAIH